MHAIALIAVAASLQAAAPPASVPTPEAQIAGAA